MKNNQMNVVTYLRGHDDAYDVQALSEAANWQTYGLFAGKVSASDHLLLDVIFLDL
jgi:hypothetical protein